MLSIVPTPIGNLKDITLRALEALREADFVVCEDTRRTQTLLSHFEIKKPLISFHDHSARAKESEILRLLEEGAKVALVTDGGTPLLSDPGFPIVREAIRKELGLEVLPGAFAAATALVASGLHAESFSFLGFLPPKSISRRNRLGELESREETLIFYESPFRLIKSLEDTKAVLGDREACVARELTKKFEEIARGRLSELIEHFSKKEIKGEITLLVAGKGRKSVLTSR